MKRLQRLAGLKLITLCILSPHSLFANPQSPTNTTAPVRVSLMFTNDLHSHFRPEKSKLGLGGIARLKTAIDRIRIENPNSLLVDNGDWSEGHIYYNLEAGTETLRMMELLTYDIASLGNHDLINGPDVLLNSIYRSRTNISFLAANADARDYARKSEFEKTILPYVIREIAGVKIAFIGLFTYEFIYDYAYEPIKSSEPFTLVRKLAAQLKEQSDAVVVLSHNSVKANEFILRIAPHVDVVISAHDHRKLTKPIVVDRKGFGPGWVVEAACWGRYLGRIELEVNHANPVHLADYRLVQIDAKIPENPEVATRLDQLDALLERQYGPIFHDYIGETQIELSRGATQEHLMGNLMTDALRSFTGASLALESKEFIYDQLHEGTIHSADVLNATPGVYDPRTGKAWTVKVLPVKGQKLALLINLLYSAKIFAERAILSVSGLQITYNPLFRYDVSPFALTPQLQMGPKNWLVSNPIVQELRVGTEPFDVNATYSVAMSGGVLEAINFLNKFIPNFIPIENIKDTNTEAWRVLADYIKSISPITTEKVSIGDRIRTEQPDLGIVESDIHQLPIAWPVILPAILPAILNDTTLKTKISVTVRNYGATAAPAGSARIRLLNSLDGTDTSIEPHWNQVGFIQTLNGLPPGASQTLTWEVSLRGERGLYPLAVQIDGPETEVNHSNNMLTTWLTASQVTLQ